MVAISIRIKILAIVLGFFVLIAAAFAVYSVITTANYRQLRTDEVSGIVAFESERVGKVIAEMERNAVDLALMGRQFYRTFAMSEDGRFGDERPEELSPFSTGEGHNRHEELGISISVENFGAFLAAVGGGIWYEPYALDADAKRVCYYAFYDPAIDAVRHDPDFQTEEYDYHTQMWYLTISAELDGKHAVVWTPPYFDDTGTNALMTTVGAGIYDDAGQLVGISTVDWEIPSMVDRLSAIKPTAGSFVLLASPKDDYIISDTKDNEADMTGQSLLMIPWYDELRFADDDTVSIGDFTHDGTRYISFSRMFGNGWLFSIQIPAQEIFSEIETRNNQFTIIIAGSFLVLLVFTAYLLSRLINRPLRKLTLGVSELGGGDLDKQIEIRSGDEFGTLAAAFNKMTVDLKESIELNVRERAEKERIGAELNVATQIQSSMLPCIFPAFPHREEFDIYASMQPAKEVGGDFYDFFLIDDHTLAVVMADVSGKGIPAALFMVITKTLIQNTALSGKSPEVVFGIVNKMLCENNDANMFVTAFLGYLDIPTGKFTFVNAGHNPPLIRSAAPINGELRIENGEMGALHEGRFEWLKVKVGFVLAGDEDTFYRQHEITLNPGDELFLYTDGVTEAVNNNQKLFGDPRLLDTANRLAADKQGMSSLQWFTESIKREIDLFAEGAEQSDDITMLALRYIGGQV